jgi:hypothetical protein
MLRYVVVLAGLLALFSMKCSIVTLGHNEYIHVDTLKVLDEINSFRDFIKYEPGKLIQIKKDINLSAKHGELTALFTENEEIRELAIHFPGDSGTKYIEYIFSDNDNLLYVQDNETFHSAPLQGQESTIIRNIVNEYYFTGNKIFIWLRDKQKIPPHYYEKKTKEIFTSLQDLINYLSRTTPNY